MSKRRYHQNVRADAAAETRRHILDTLYERLREAPAEPVSVDQIARRARVSRSTIYLIFGSRSGLFDALTDRLIQGAGYDRIVEATRHPDARETLRGGLEGGVHMYAAHHEVLRVLYATGKLDPEGAGRDQAHPRHRHRLPPYVSGERIPAPASVARPRVVVVDQRDGESVGARHAGRANEATTDDDRVGRRRQDPALHVDRAVGQPAQHAVDIDDHRTRRGVRG